MTPQQVLTEQLGFQLPADYLAYLIAKPELHYGTFYLAAANELITYNTDYEAAEFYPGYFLIGSDGGGEALAIEKSTGYFVMTPFIGHDANTPTVLGRMWPDFLTFLEHNAV